MTKKEALALTPETSVRVLRHGEWVGGLIKEVRQDKTDVIVTVKTDDGDVLVTDHSVIY